MNDMIAYCGLNCEKCDAFIATQNNDNALREKTAKLWSELNNVLISVPSIPNLHHQHKELKCQNVFLAVFAAY